MFETISQTKRTILAYEISKDVRQYEFRRHKWTSNCIQHFYSFNQYGCILLEIVVNMRPKYIYLHIYMVDAL